MSKYVDANDKILYTWVCLQTIATVCHLIKKKLALQIILFTVELQFHLE